MLSCQAMAAQTKQPPPIVGGRFHVIDALGDGGTATVYLAWDNQQKGWCALKALHYRHLNDQEMRGRFSHEAAALERLSHPHVIALVAHDPDALPPYTAIELARGGSVMDWLKANGPMPPAIAGRIICEISTALEYAHELGIVHRDAKPHNFLLDEHGSSKLTDFGIARIDDSTSLTQTGSQIGTFSFMAPEQRQDAKSVDFRADIYSLGASLYTMLTARTSAELFVADQDDELLADIPQRFRDVILRATRYRPEERYPSVSLFGEAVVRAMGRVGPEAPIVSPPPLPDLPPRVIPPNRRLLDLVRALSAADSGASAPEREKPELTQSPESEPKRVMPYYMPTRPRTPSIERLRQAQAYHLAEREQTTITVQGSEEDQPHITPSGARPRPSLPPSARPPAQSEGRSLMWLAIIPAPLAVIAVFVAIGIGGYQVSNSRRESSLAASRFERILRDESSVVYQIDSDRSQFEQLWDDYQKADDDDRMQIAVDFVDALDRSLPADASDAVVFKVRRLRDGRDRYLSARSAWGQRARSFPGVVAVELGLSAAPPRDR